MFYVVLLSVAWVAAVYGGVFFPEEIVNILGLSYSHVPRTKIGTDSRFGLGFRMGNNADAQFLMELGPQRETAALGPMIDRDKQITRRQSYPPTGTDQVKNPMQTTHMYSKQAIHFIKAILRGIRKASNTIKHNESDIKKQVNNDESVPEDVVGPLRSINPHELLSHNNYREINDVENPLGDSEVSSEIGHPLHNTENLTSETEIFSKQSFNCDEIPPNLPEVSNEQSIKNAEIENPSRLSEESHIQIPYNTERPLSEVEQSISAPGKSSELSSHITEKSLKDAEGSSDPDKPSYNTENLSSYIASKLSPAIVENFTSVSVESSKFGLYPYKAEQPSSDPEDSEELVPLDSNKTISDSEELTGTEQASNSVKNTLSEIRGVTTSTSEEVSNVVENSSINNAVANSINDVEEQLNVEENSLSNAEESSSKLKENTVTEVAKIDDVTTQTEDRLEQVHIDFTQRNNNKYFNEKTSSKKLKLVHKYKGQYPVFGINVFRTLNSILTMFPIS